MSLRPPVTEKNEELIYNKINEIYKPSLLYKQSSKTSSQKTVVIAYNIIEDIDELEDLIGDETFAAFLNYDAEVQIENSVYKYTDTGLFIVPVDNYKNLNVYLDNQSISKTLLQPTDEIVAKTYIETNGVNDLYTVDAVNKIQYFGSPCNIEPNEYNILSEKNNLTSKAIADCGSTSTSGGTTTGDTTTIPIPIDPLDGLQEFVDGMTTCSASNGIFGSLFGTNKVCKDSYESGRRVKTKAFNYNYYLVYHAGVKVKHQKKGWTGLWRKEDTDIIALGASRISYDYDINPVLASALKSLNFSETKLSSKKYGYQWTFNTNAYAGEYGYLNITAKTTFSKNLYPTAFQDDLVIETFTNNELIDNALELADNLLIKEKLNKFFWNGAQQATKWAVKNYLTFDSNYKVPKERTLVFKSPKYGRILVQKSVFENCSNCDKQDKTVDFGFTLKATIKPENNWSIKPSIGDLNLQPKRFGAELYGVIKRGGQWHGSLINF